MPSPTSRSANCGEADRRVPDQENVIDAVAFDDDGRVLTDGTVENLHRHTYAEEAIRRHVESSEALLVEFSAT